ncbi:hypothetical protein [Candidatus Magnetominusculus xianensis]|uniref:Uncharacterized protein n=1 Tax=Candidatus Magnetominusculus xianensis TaxID=1748249 RepID=A0ABR5SCH1_9BACT|nr:hypothetical protein [Candidatus Magnetominusculus xianensis]KWT77352.1 hypothetical protein ASN18_3047 [Candidatus Magnetominusculus xianensis]MBF0404965.1 hypothetical protein [Nitrospirota bacterium]
MTYNQNAFFGSGILYIDTLAADGTRTGELHVGNTEVFQIEAAKSNKKELKSSMPGNFGQTLASVVIDTSQGVKFTLRDIKRKNLVLALFGEDSDIAQTAATVTDEAVVAAIGKYKKLEKRSLKQSPAPVVLSGDKTVTAADISFTAATKTIASAGGDFLSAGFAAGQKILISDTVDNNGVKTIATVAQHTITVTETLTDEAAGSAALTVQYTANTDYEIDYAVGRIIALETGGITETETLTISYQADDYSAYKVKANTMTQRDVFIRFVGVNIVDKKPVEVVVYKVTLEPTAALDWLANDYAKLDMSGQIMVTPEGTWEVIMGYTKRQIEGFVKAASELRGGCPLF